MITIKGTPEGRPGVWLADKESLKEWIVAKGVERIHNMNTSVPGIAIGADHSVKSVLGDIDAATRVAVLIGDTRRTNMNHALALVMTSERPPHDERLEIYDIGEVTESDIEQG